jgi:hypothetical protein
LFNSTSFGCVIVSVSTETVRGALNTEEACICLEFSVCSACCPVPTRRGEFFTNDRGPASGRGPGAQLCCACFCLSMTIQIKPLIASPRHSATGSQYFRISVKTFSQSALFGRGGGGRRNFSNGTQACSRRPCCRTYRPGKLLHVNTVGQIFASVSRVYSVVRRGTFRLQLPLLG